MYGLDIIIIFCFFFVFFVVVVVIIMFTLADYGVATVGDHKPNATVFPYALLHCNMI